VPEQHELEISPQKDASEDIPDDILSTMKYDKKKLDPIHHEKLRLAENELCEAGLPT
jgi:hypothetical protein